MRRAELFNLEWKQVDLKNQQLTFSGKGDKIRTVLLNDKAMDILMNRQGHKVKHISGRVFWEITSIDLINPSWRRMQGETKLKARFYDLRHTYVSYFIMNGGSEYHLKDILGHASLLMVQKYG